MDSVVCNITYYHSTINFFMIIYDKHILNIVGMTILDESKYFLNIIRKYYLKMIKNKIATTLSNYHIAI